MTPDDRRHGTYAGAQTHIRHSEKMCEPCRMAFRRYQRLADNERQLGHRRRVPTAPIRAHVQYLVSTGMPAPQIAARSGVSRSTVQDLISHPRKTMTRDLANCLLEVTPAPVPHACIDATGSRRRVQALACLGWSYTDVANEAHQLGHPLTTAGVRQFMADGGPVKVRTARAVTEVYENLSMRFAPPSRGSSNVKARAVQRRYAPPLAWADIDDPTETPAGSIDRARHKDDIDEAVVLRVMGGEVLPMTTGERAEVVDRCRRKGLSYGEIEDRTGISKVDRHVKRAKEAAA